MVDKLLFMKKMHDPCLSKSLVNANYITGNNNSKERYNVAEMLKMNKREKYNDSGKLVFGQNMYELKDCCGDFPDRTERSEYIYCKMET